MNHWRELSGNLELRGNPTYEGRGSRHDAHRKRDDNNIQETHKRERSNMTDPKRRRKTSLSPAIQTQPLFPPSLVIPQQPSVAEVMAEQGQDVVKEQKVSPEMLSAGSIGSATSVTPLVRFFVLVPQSLMTFSGTGPSHKGCPGRVIRKHSVQSRSKR